MLEDGLQLFQFKGWGDAEHALVAVETAVRHQNVTVGIMSDEVAKRLHGDDGAGDGIIFGNHLLEKDLQGFPGAAAEGGKKLPVIEEVSAEDLRDAEDEMTVGYLLEDIHAEPFPELDHTLLMARWTKMPSFTRECQQVFMAAIFAFHAGKAVVQIAAIEIPIDHLLDIGPPEAVLPGKMLVIDPDKGLKIVLHAPVVIG